ncbi:NADH oxidoreductase (quinone) subunit F [Boudabousia liubingyangii]|uniref:NADH-quinone oxidoreductase subunit F n=1 Tax=Boudabousia liubingyangii TaxID=1921764 RepID=A0A1Q5PQ86_9ACTO|nr:NADH-quinone oxidoreductase subunit NuoF [Boudabousia liubingyangii]OKL48295.1 NADH oxidoreductase (quinone) subunit F [Boudabousia liubingyangii]OKL49669.1 NADH oxidoreductase (quinone) subunit F [Boudabousia liubingyangii]
MSIVKPASKLTPVLTDMWDRERSWNLESYRANGGYEGLEKALKMERSELVDMIKASGLRGRGGAGFPTGLKWSFLPPDDGKARYLVVNADESEPGTCKDIPTMMANPHVLIEGVAITSHAIRCEHAFIYLRGEVVHVYRRLMNAVREAREAGLIGQGVGPNGDFNLEITVHAGAGAYICGEETALLDSLEGRRGHPRLKPPFPAVAGLYARPTVVNNVESIASVPGILRNGNEWFGAMGTEKSKGHGIFSISGHVKHPGQFEAPFGITMRELIEMAGGIRDGHKLKFWTPGGSSTPIFTEEELDIPLDYESVGAAGSMLGTRALQVFDETTSVVRVIARWTEFYQHESCGKCTPCREGTYWLKQVMLRLEAGQGQPGDIDLLLDVAGNIAGKSFCALGDAAATPISSGIKRFREEFEAGLTTPARELFPYEASSVFNNKEGNR